MSYEEMRDYLRLLKKQQEAGQEIRMDFDKVPIDRLKACAPGKSMGLQLADAASGAFFNALERDKFGNTEPRYLQSISPVLYRHEGNLWGYGFKIAPSEAKSGLIAKEESLKWLLEFK